MKRIRCIECEHFTELGAVCGEAPRQKPVKQSRAIRNCGAFVLAVSEGLGLSKGVLHHRINCRDWYVTAFGDTGRFNGHYRMVFPHPVAWSEAKQEAQRHWPFFRLESYNG